MLKGWDKMSIKQARALVVAAYKKHGGGSRQHIKALKRYDSIAGTWTDYEALEKKGK